MANDIRGWMGPEFPRYLPYEGKPRKNLQQRKLTRPGIEPVPAMCETTMSSFDHRGGWTIRSQATFLSCFLPFDPATNLIQTLLHIRLIHFVPSASVMVQTGVDGRHSCYTLIFNIWASYPSARPSIGHEFIYSKDAGRLRLSHH